MHSVNVLGYYLCLVCLQTSGIPDNVLRPEAVMFRDSSITCVAAMRSNSWIVLFFGTETGLLVRVGNLVGSLSGRLDQYRTCVVLDNRYNT